MTKEEQEQLQADLKTSNETNGKLLKENEALEKENVILKKKVEKLEKSEEDSKEKNDQLAKHLSDSDENLVAAEKALEDYKTEHGDSFKANEDALLEKREAAQKFRTKTESIDKLSKDYFKSIQEIIKS